VASALSRRAGSGPANVVRPSELLARSGWPYFGDHFGKKLEFWLLPDGVSVAFEAETMIGWRPAAPFPLCGSHFLKGTKVTFVHC
jgi:hypothetical protein